jgi:hypothetical protein
MNLCLIRMQSGIDLISETYELLPRRSVDHYAPSSSAALLASMPEVQPPASLTSLTPTHRRISSPVNNKQKAVSLFQSHKVCFELDLEDHIKKTRQAAKFLKQIIHAKKCMLLDEANTVPLSNIPGSSKMKCGFPSCQKTKEILKHVNICNDTFCQLPGCQTTKKLLSHSETCSKSWYQLSGTTKAQKDFCLLCTIAHNSEETNPSSTTSSTYPASGLNSPKPSYEDTTTSSSLEDQDLLPLIQDEIRTFSRIPFQKTPSPVNSNSSRSIFASGYHHLSLTNPVNQSPLRGTRSPLPGSPARGKTYSDSTLTGTLSPARVTSEGSNKKQRSKSWNPLTLDLSN